MLKNDAKKQCKQPLQNQVKHNIINLPGCAQHPAQLPLAAVSAAPSLAPPAAPVSNCG